MANLLILYIACAVMSQFKRRRDILYSIVRILKFVKLINSSRRKHMSVKESVCVIHISLDLHRL